MKSLKSPFILAALSLLLVAGCNKSNDNSTTVSRRSARGGINNNYTGQYTQFNQTGGGSYFYSASTGRVFSDAQYANEFSEAMRGLVSATLSHVGRIPLDGVKLRGYIELDQSGNLIPGRSSMALEIRDEFTGQSENGQIIPPIVINIPATSGRASSYGTTLVFSDSYGSMTLQGSFSNGVSGAFSGTLSYQNTVNEHAGSGLRFEISTCGFFRCQ